MQEKQISHPEEGRRSDSYCSCAVLRRAARRVTQSYDKALKPAGLRLTQYSVLANLSRHEGLSITELAERLAMDRTTLTRNLRPMEREGWITRAAGADKRSRAVGITASGRALFERAFPLWQEAERGFRRKMGRDTVAELRQLLDAVVAGGAD